MSAFGVETFYVSPDGNDAWSGKLEFPNPEGTDGPLASIVGARDAIRGMREVTSPIHVLFASGTYEMTEPVVFEPMDSGTEEFPIVYAAAPGAKPLFSGGRTITNFVVHEDGVWKTHVPGVAEGEWYFKQLWVNGRRATRARTPSEFTHYMLYSISLHDVRMHTEPPTFETQAFLTDSAGQRIRRFDMGLYEGLSEVDVEHRVFVAEPEDIEPLLGLSQEELEDVLVFVYHSWFVDIHRIQAIDAETSTVVLTGPGGSRELHRWGAERQRYRLENFPAALSEPGEWFLARDGTLSYMPREGEVISEVEAIAPGADAFIRIEGNPYSQQFAEHLHFQGLIFRHAGRVEIPCEGLGVSQGAAATYPGRFTAGAAIEINGSRHIGFSDCEIAHVGAYAIWFRDGCSDSRIERCLLYDLGAGGIRLGLDNYDGFQPLDHRITDRITVHNNIVRGGGRVYQGGKGILVGHSGYNEITHNQVSDFYYTGISVGWQWGYNGQWSYGENKARENMVDFNRIRHIGQGVLSDMGGVYTLGESQGGKIRNNVIHDVYSYDYYGRGGFGIYHDQSSREYTTENNLVYNTKTGGFFQHYGRNNVVRNNIFATGMNDSQVSRGRRDDFPYHESEPCLIFTNNIVYWNNESPLFRHNMTDTNVVFHHNLYWNTLGEDYVRFNGLTLDEWHDPDTGRGEGSLIEDPLFIAPQNDDYHLQPGSPAAAIGFEPFDYEAAGVYGDDDWVALAGDYEYPPLRLAAPPPPVPPMELYKDFEDMTVGSAPALAIADDPQGLGDKIVVTDEKAAVGSKSLKVQNMPGMAYPWQPHFFYRPKHRNGYTTLSFYFLNEPGAHWRAEWREYHVKWSSYWAGPRVTVQNSRIFAGDHFLDIPDNQWIHVKMTAALGEQGDGTWRVEITLPGNDRHVFSGLPFHSADFRHLDWLGFMSLSTGETAFYLDGMSLKNIIVRISSIILNEDEVALTWNCIGSRYTVEVSTNLVSGDWSSCNTGGNAWPIDESFWTGSLPVEVEQQFYRIRISE